MLIRNSQIQDTIEKYRQVSPCKVELSGRTTLQDKGSLRSNYYFSSTSFLFVDNFMANGKVGREGIGLSSQSKIIDVVAATIQG